MPVFGYFPEFWFIESGLNGSGRNALTTYFLPFTFKSFYGIWSIVHYSILPFYQNFIIFEPHALVLIF